MTKIVEVLPDKTALVQRALSLSVAKIQEAIAEKGSCTLALSGGSTPRPLYQELAFQKLPWQNIHIFWGDERYVPSDHPDSNQRMARLAWLDHVAIPAENIHPMPTEPSDPAAAAALYEQEIRRHFQIQPPHLPAFDLVWLGMGDDGHTASLFPHTEALTIHDRLITVGLKDEQPRLTFTASLINHAHCVMFLVAGASKRPALAAIFQASGDSCLYPARLINPQGELWWLLDADAGAELKR